jgi:hypothetical protein
MPEKEEIAGLRKEIKKKERDLYRVTKEMNTWKEGRHRPPSNAGNFKIFVEKSKKEIANLSQKLAQLEKAG